MADNGTRQAGPEARLDIEAGDGGRLLKASGDWAIGSLDAVNTQIRALQPDSGMASRIDVSEVKRLDTAGAWLLQIAAKAIGAEDLAAAVDGADDNQRLLIEEVAKHQPEPIPPRVHGSAIVHAIARLGRALQQAGNAGYEMLGFSGLMLDVSLGTLLLRRKLRVNSVVHNIEAAGLDAVPIIALISFLVGAVISFMAADVLGDYGGQIFAVDLISFAFLREFGVLLAAIMVAGRSGSAYTAEIGAMKSHEEIDAMRVLGLDPVEILVIPRMLALLIALPVLTFLSDIAGLIGGAAVSWAALGLSPASFVNRFLEVTTINHFWVGMIKAPFFAFLISMIGCYQGFEVTGTAESVGERTTLSVVQSIFTVIVFDALFAMFFLEIKY